MKYLIFSDLHGSASGLELLKGAVAHEKPDMILCLGDVLYGASDGDEAACAEYLSHLPCPMLAAKGNCDYEVDGHLINAPLKDQIVLYLEGYRIRARHIPWWSGLEPGDIALSGHTHIKELFEDRGIIICNPGSIGKPRDGSASYAIIDEKSIVLKNAFGFEAISTLNLNS